MKQYQYDNLISMLYFIMSLTMTNVWAKLACVIIGTGIAIKAIVSAVKDSE